MCNMSIRQPYKSVINSIFIGTKNTLNLLKSFFRIFPIFDEHISDYTRKTEYL